MVPLAACLLTFHRCYACPSHAFRYGLLPGKSLFYGWDTLGVVSTAEGIGA